MAKHKRYAHHPEFDLTVTFRVAGYDVLLDVSTVARLGLRPARLRMVVIAAKPYAVVRGGRNGLLLHRAIAGTPPGLLTDHRNGNTLDNRERNLRVCDDAQNSQNARSRVGSMSRYKGVTKFKPGGKWCVQIVARGVCHWGGSYDDEEDAARAADRLTLLHHGPYARLNFPTGLADFRA